MTRKNYRYDIPSIDELALSESLSKKLKNKIREGQDAIWETFLYAAGLRKAYLKNDKWNSSFKTWYHQNELHMCFGSFSQFSKVASAGEVINYFGTNFTDEDYILSALPTSMNALYEISLLIKGRSKKEIAKWIYSGGEKLDDESGELLGIISPVASAADIRDFRMSLEHSSSSTSSESKSTRQRDYSVPIATIYAHKSLFTFNKKGEHEGDVDLEGVKEQIRLLKRLDKSSFDVRDNLTKIQDRYRLKEERSDPVKKVYAKKAPRTKKKRTK